MWHLFYSPLPTLTCRYGNVPQWYSHLVYFSRTVPKVLRTTGPSHTRTQSARPLVRTVSRPLWNLRDVQIVTIFWYLNAFCAGILASLVMAGVTANHWEHGTGGKWTGLVDDKPASPHVVEVQVSSQAPHKHTNTLANTCTLSRTRKSRTSTQNSLASNCRRSRTRSCSNYSPGGFVRDLEICFTASTLWRCWLVLGFS